VTLPITTEQIPPSIRDHLPAGDAFAHIMRLQGEVFRDVVGRQTIRVTLGGNSYFVKQHFGVGWGEIVKNLLTGRLPILGAETEWRAIHCLDELGIPTTPAVAYARRGRNPARQQSFVITHDLGDIVSLETLCADWKSNPPDANFKRRLILAVAEIARKLHDNGLNHRDFYICHFCLDRVRMTQGEILLYLLDLHRVGINDAISPVARMKDIAALYFSALDIGLTRRDCLLFAKHYRGRLRNTLRSEQAFWKQVDNRARKLFEKFHGRWPVTPFDERIDNSGENL
jgi:heptose I phosphotransferase